MGLACLVLAVAGCSGEEPKRIDDVLGTTAATPTPTRSAVPATTPTPTRAAFPKNCTDLVPSGAITAAVGRGRLAGGRSFVYAGPVASSGRLERTTCGYGIRPAPDGAGKVTRLEVSLVRYGDAKTARGRLDVTAQAALSRGSAVTEQAVAGRPGVVLRDGKSLSYAVADGPRTLVVTLRTGVVPFAAMKVSAVDLARRVLRLPARTPSPAPGTSTKPAASPAG